MLIKVIEVYRGFAPGGDTVPLDGLLFAGRVGTGLSDKLLANLYAKFQKLKAPSCPFVNLQEQTRGRWVLGITPAVMKRCHWVKPVLIAQALGIHRSRLAGWLKDGRVPQMPITPLAIAALLMREKRRARRARKTALWLQTPGEPKCGTVPWWGQQRKARK